MYIQDAKDLFVSTFPDHWIEGPEFNWLNNQNSAISFGHGSQKIQNFERELFILLSKSILTGEYIRRVNRWDEFLGQFENLLPTESSSDDSLKGRLQGQFNSLSLSISSVINQFNSFKHAVIRCFETSDEVQSPFFTLVRSNNDGESSWLFLRALVRYVLYLARLDHFLLASKQSVKDLIFLSEQLKDAKYLSASDNSEISFIYTVLQDKCNFLIKKAAYNDHSNYDIDGHTYNTVNIDSAIQSLIQSRKSFEYLYPADDNVHLFDKNIIAKWQYNCQTRTAKMSEYLRLMKHYQKNTCDQKQMDHLIAEFDDAYLKCRVHYLGRRLYDVFALDTQRNYMYNCRFSHFLTIWKGDLKELQAHIGEVELVQKETRINNFFPYKKAAEALIDNIKLCFQKELNTESITSRISYLSQIILKFERNLNWCQLNKFHPFYLMTNECFELVEYQNIPIRMSVFIASTYSKPIRYHEVQKALDRCQVELQILRGTQDALEVVIKERQEILRIKVDFDKDKRRNLELLGIFTGIITFLFGSISFGVTTYQDDKAPSIITNSMGLGVILLVFASVIYMITAEKPMWKQGRFWMFFIIFIVYTLFAFRYLITKVS